MARKANAIRMKKPDKATIIQKVNNNRLEFFSFLKNYNVIQLAVGVVVGNAVKDLVSSIADNLIMPLIGIFTPSGTWEKITLNLAGTSFRIGLFLSSLIDFLIVALVVFIVLKKILRIELTNK